MSSNDLPRDEIAARHGTIPHGDHAHVNVRRRSNPGAGRGHYRPTRTYKKLLYLKWLTMAEVFGDFLHSHPADSRMGVDVAD